MNNQVQTCTLFLLVEQLRQILTLSDFRQMVMMIICPLLFKNTRINGKSSKKCKTVQELELVHAPIYQMVAKIAHQEKIRYKTRLYITLRFDTPSKLDVWKELNKLSEDKKLETCSFLVPCLSHITAVNDMGRLIE